MKKWKIAIIILISLILIVALLILNNTFKKVKIRNCIIFESTEYESIDNVVFYSKDTEMDELLKTSLTLIADELKTNYPNKTILYLRDLGDGFAQTYDALKSYRCIQIINGQKIYDTDMNIFIHEDRSVDIDFLIGCSWSFENNTENINITQSQAKEILIDYLIKNPSDYNTLSGNVPEITDIDSTIIISLGPSEEYPAKCTIELYNYKSKISWKMNLGSSYVIIDANTGEILGKYFHPKYIF